ncbi:MAG TPA: MarR family transcriptional regulator, partial [Candidatus Acidoferrales bacterium]|nr:MarR family transcriptional regulator [Candidatus Acidoferrales bacterium]
RADVDATTDMAPLRRGVAGTCARYGGCDYDTVNALLTLKRTAADIENHTADYLKQVDLSPGRLSVLMVLNAYPDRQMPLSEIGQYLTVSRPNITGLIDSLVEDGLVKRIDHPDDRRMILAHLTPQGKEFMRKFVPFHLRVVNNAMAALTKNEKRQLVALLDKLRVHLHEVSIPQLEEA